MMLLSYRVFALALILGPAMAMPRFLPTHAANIVDRVSSPSPRSVRLTNDPNSARQNRRVKPRATRVLAHYTQGHMTCVEPGGHIYTVGALPNENGQYAPADGEPLVVAMNLTRATISPVNIFAKTGILQENYPYVGAINGFGSTDTNLAPDSYNYAFLAGTEKTEPGKPAVDGINSFGDATGFGKQKIQSSIWRYDAEHGYLTPQWINTDGKASVVSVFYLPSADTFAMTGNLTAFINQFGSVKECRLKFVEIPSSPTNRT